MEKSKENNFIINELETKNVKDVYENIADHFSKTRVFKWSWVINFLDKLKQESLVYDLGCGNGRNMDHGSLNFVGIDNCENFVKICKEKNLKVINSNITSIPLKSDTADAIICIAVFHHLSSPKTRLDALFEMKRLIKKNGKILLSVWSINQPKKIRRTFNEYGNNIVLWDNNKGKVYERFYYIYKLDEIKELFKKVGLSIVNYEYNCGNEIFTLIKL